ncbi:uncharacterized protein LOC132264191 [Phlebotomus argentipes]|uniref:uncharacterized protein LOC132264191 n=1 Tax=Phlebotomus argentipes TaxID=94469 RepID=UPI002892D8B7|nr:uncharacterized protein LOC132264191 [Phlebotomus argentipes]
MQFKWKFIISISVIAIIFYISENLLISSSILVMAVPAALNVLGIEWTIPDLDELFGAILNITTFVSYGDSNANIDDVDGFGSDTRPDGGDGGDNDGGATGRFGYDRTGLTL